MKASINFLRRALRQNLRPLGQARGGAEMELAGSQRPTLVTGHAHTHPNWAPPLRNPPHLASATPHQATGGRRRGATWGAEGYGCPGPATNETLSRPLAKEIDRGSKSASSSGSAAPSTHPRSSPRIGEPCRQLLVVLTQAAALRASRRSSCSRAPARWCAAPPLMPFLQCTLPCSPYVYILQRRPDMEACFPLREEESCTASDGPEAPLRRAHALLSSPPSPSRIQSAALPLATCAGRRGRDLPH